MIEVFQRLDDLQREMQQLRGMVEEQSHSQDGVKQRQRDLYIDLDQRISDLQKSVKAMGSQPAATIAPPLPVIAPSGVGLTAPTVGEGSLATPPVIPVGDSVVPAPAEMPVVPVTAEQPTSAMDSLQEQGSYQQALDQLMAGSYEASITAFTGFLSP